MKTSTRAAARLLGAGLGVVLLSMSAVLGGCDRRPGDPLPPSDPARMAPTPSTSLPSPASPASAVAR